MNARWFTILMVLLAAFACGLVACKAEQPRLIGSYPAQEEPKPLALSPRSAPQPGLQLVYESWITLEVSRAASAADRAVEMTAQRGGYLESSNSWLQDGRTVMILVLAIPAAGFDSLREELLNLGTLQSEQVSGEWVHTTWERPTYSRITLTLKPRSADLPDLTISGWDPGRTFHQALDVFVSIFGFLVDILIWVVVVLGPFALLALGLRALWRKVR